MSDTRPTPETDKTEKSQSDHGTNHLYRLQLMTDFARKLERERDDAIKALETDFMQGAYARLKYLQECERKVTELESEIEAMCEAIKEVSKILLSIKLNDIFEETMRNHAILALAKLKPFLP